MSQTARDTYLETQVLTATPQKLRMMLIEGALKFGNRALELWDDPDQREPCYNALVRCRDIVAELYASIQRDSFPPARRTASVYAFLFRQLAEAPAYQDAQRVHDVLRVLEEEWETWRQLCEAMPEAPPRDDHGHPGCAEITASGLEAIQPGATVPSSGVQEPRDRLSLEA